MNTSKALAWLILGGTWAVACGGATVASGSNSNWLDVCSKTADCSAGLSCWCGVCTTPCSPSNACGAGNCVAPGDVGLSCSVQPAANACAVACTSNAECASVRPGLTCANGICRNQSSGITDGGTRTCESRISEATQAFQAAVDSADRSCRTSADCDRVAVGRCGFSGCSLYPVSNVGASEAMATERSINNAICTPGRAAGCFSDSGAFINCPVIPAGPPACVAGKCTDDATLVEGGSLTCDERTAEITQRRTALLATLDLTCQRDADCVITDFVRCVSQCGTLATTADVAALASQVSALEADLCTPFTDAGCTAPPLPCPFPGTAACVKGQCALMPPGAMDGGPRR